MLKLLEVDVKLKLKLKGYFEVKVTLKGFTCVSLICQDHLLTQSSQLNAKYKTPQLILRFTKGKPKP